MPTNPELPSRRDPTILARRSVEIIQAGQAPSGAYVACPTYPTYKYAWFRDGTFSAHAVERAGDRAGAARFYTWACGLVVARTYAVERCVQAAAARELPDPADLLHTRYTLEGQTGSEEWPNFQLDGFGTLLWGIEQHIHGQGQRFSNAPLQWQTAVRLLLRYLAALWQQPNYDCWEEFPDRIAVSTLATLYAGLHAAASLLPAGDADGEAAAAAATAIRAYVLQHGTSSGHLIKHVDGDDAVDASLVWAATPYGAHALFTPHDPLMIATARRIASDLVGSGGGVHRYVADTFYGGGEWTLLTALLGQFYVDAGDRMAALRCLEVVEGQADDDGLLPEQWNTAVLAPEYVREWIARWGPVAKPLLWAHAEYLSLWTALGPV